MTAHLPAGITASMLIYKVFHAAEWAVLRDQGRSFGAPIDLADGYVHLSTGAQVSETCAKYFAGEDNLVLLALQSDSLGAALKWEPSRGGALFPHLYRALTLADILWHRDLPRGDDGHIFPDGVV